MRKSADWYGCHQFRCRASAEGLHLVRSADSHVSKLAIAIVGEVHVVGYWSSFQQCFLFERRLGIEYLHFARVLQGDPNFVIFRAYGDVGTKGTGLNQPFNNLVRRDLDDGEFRNET